MRTTVLPGAVVRGSDGQLVGRVRDIYLHDRSGEFAAITVKPGQLSSRTVLIPAAAIVKPGAEGADEPGAAAGGSGTAADGSGAAADEPGAPVTEAPAVPDDAPHTQDTAVHLRVDSMTVRAGISAPDTDHVTPEQLRLAARELGIEEAATG